MKVRSLAAVIASLLLGCVAARPPAMPYSKPDATTEARAAASVNASPAALAGYLASLKGQKKHVLTGQISSYWHSNALDNVEKVTADTGLTPAMTEVVLTQGVGGGMVGSTQVGVAVANQALAKGMIVIVAVSGKDPFTDAYDKVRPLSLAPLYTPGNQYYTRWRTYLANWAAQLKQIKGAVIWQPFGEMNGDWSWFGADDPIEFQNLWRDMRAYFDAAGVKNIVWLYSVNSLVGKYTAYYAGGQFVDLVGMHSYPPSPKDFDMYNALQPLGKPILYAEAGVVGPVNPPPPPNAGDNGQLLATVVADFPDVVGVDIFCLGWALPVQNGEKAFMTNAAALTLSDLPH